MSNTSSKKKLNYLFKLSFSTLILSGSVLSYQFTPEAHAQTTQEILTTKENAVQEKEELLKNIKDAKKEIANMDYLEAKEKTLLLKSLDKAKDQSIVERILTEAKENDEEAQQIDKETIQKELDKKETEKPFSDKQAIKETQPKDEKQEIEQSKELNKDEDTQISSELDKIAEEANSKQENVEKEIAPEQKASSEEAIKEPNKEEANHSSNQEDTTEIPSKETKEKLKEEVTNNSTKEEDLQAKINQAITDKDTLQKDKEADANKKIDTLKQYEQSVENKKDLAQKDKDALKNEINKVKENVGKQNKDIVDYLASSKDKTQAVKDIINGVYNPEEAKKIIDNITIKSMTDQQIANQITRQFDEFAAITSDDLLKSMFDRVKDKKGLIEAILITRLNESSAQEIADKIMKNNPSSVEIIDQLKQHFKAGTKVTADDILGSVLDNAQDKRQALETILNSKLDQDKARIMADIIAKKDMAKNNILGALKSELRNKADNLFQLEGDLQGKKNKAQDIISPITDRPSLLDRINDRPSVLDKLGSGGSLLDGIKGPENPSPGKALSLGSSNGGLLSGLFDDNGNFSLPKAGEVVKQSTVPVAVLLTIIGASLLWFSKRKKTKQN